MKRHYRLKATVVTLLSIVVGWPLFAHADDESLAIEVDRQPLAAALNSFSQQTGIQFAYVSTVADGIESPGTSGEASTVQALDSMLAETGLAYSFVNDTTIVIAVADNPYEDYQTGGIGPGNLENQQPMLMAQNQRSREQATESSRQSDEGMTSIVIGKVTDARTGANLKGAIVTIEEIGRWVSTSDLGEFRFVGVPRGSMTLTVSYLGYARQSVVIGIHGESVSQNFSLRGEGEVEEIVVFGQRSARALALNQERTADNVATVLSSDLLGNFNGDTISEALRRAPGIGFVRDLETGDGANIIIRGLDPDLNQVTLNGVRLANNDGVGRSADLSNILTESVSEVRVNKTLLADQDSNGIGGFVEIATKGPLDRAKRFLSASIEGTERGSDFGDGFQGSLTASQRLGSADNFGVSASVQYRERSLTNFSARSNPLYFGQYEPALPDGSPGRRRDVDPRQPFPFEKGVDEIYPGGFSLAENTVETENLSISATAQWKLTSNTDLRFDYQRFEEERSVFSGETGATIRSSYIELPIEELGGEIRRSLVTEDRFGDTGIEGFYSQGYDVGLDRKNTTELFAFKGSTKIDGFSIDYSASYSEGGVNNPREYGFAPRIGESLSLEPEVFLKSIQNNTVDGRVVSAFLPMNGQSRPSVIGLLPSQFGLFSDESIYSPRVFTTGSYTGGNDRFSASFDIKYVPSLPILEEISVGVFYEDSEFFTRQGDSAFYFFDSSSTLEDVGLSFEGSSFDVVGYPSEFILLSPSDVAFLGEKILDLFESNESLGSVSLFPADADRNRARTVEEELAYYGQVKLRHGKFDGVFGVRISDVDISSTELQSPSIFDPDFVPDFEFQRAFRRLVDGFGSRYAVLPRAVLNYRPNEQAVFRFGYFKSVAPPQVGFLNEGSSALTLYQTDDPNEQNLLFVRIANPDLEPAETDSFDLSVEYYLNDVGSIKFGAFYKNIDNILQDNTLDSDLSIADIPLPDFPAFNELTDENTRISGSSPINGASPAEIWGLEGSVEARLTFLPRVFEGLGVYANATYTDSEVELSEVFEDAPSVDDTGNLVRDDVPFTVNRPFVTSPELTGTFGLTYENHGFDASLLYSYQSEYQSSSFRDFGLDRYADEFESLDLRVQYNRGVGSALFSIYFEANDLLRASKDGGQRSLVGGEGGVPKIVSGESYYGGRFFTLGTAINF